MARVRTRDLLPYHTGGRIKTTQHPKKVWGYTYNNGGTSYLTDLVPSDYLGRETCRDYLTPRPHKIDNPLTLDKYETKPMLLNGCYTKRKKLSFFYVYDTVCFENFSAPQYASWDDSLLMWSSEINAGKDRLPSLALDAIENALPSPEVDILLFLFEMKDFPRMLRDLGRVLDGNISPRDIPGGNLAYEFGWKPLISDLQKLVSYADKVEKRLSYLKKLATGYQKIQRRLFREERVGSWSSPFDRTSYVKLQRQTKRIDNAWYTLELRMDPSKLPPDHSEQIALAKASAFSSNLRPSTIWNAIPWSWLIDWFTNIGTYLSIASNAAGFEWKDLNVMYTMEREMDYRVYSQSVPGSVVVTTPRLSAISKNRYVKQSGLPLDLFDMPIITNRMSGILASLVTARSLKGAR